MEYPDAPFSVSGPAGCTPSGLALFWQLELRIEVFLLSRSLLGFAQVLTKMTVATLRKVCSSAAGMHPAMQQHLKWK